MIKSLLKTVHDKDTYLLDELQEQIGNNPNIAWYPSAGLDFRGLIEINRTSTVSNLFFHSDYNKTWVELKCGEVFNDKRTCINIERITELKFRGKINYRINPEYVDFPKEGNRIPKVFLLSVRVKSNFGIIRKPVLYFFMENINFLDEILLKNKIKLSHFIKVREGCGYGGNKKSISIAYAYLVELGVRHLLVDREEHTDKELINSISVKHKIYPKKYALKKVANRCNISNWSDLSVTVFDLELIADGIMSEEDFNRILNVIKLG